jgi:hypothetical protein
VRRLWDAILPNLCKDVSKRNAAFFTTLSASSGFEPDTPSAGSLAGASKLDLVAFSCGHVFQREGFYEVVLQEFKARMDTLSPLTPVSTALLVHEYHRKVIGLACPHCLHNSLVEDTRVEQSHPPPPPVDPIERQLSEQLRVTQTRMWHF